MGPLRGDRAPAARNRLAGAVESGEVKSANRSRQRAGGSPLARHPRVLSEGLRAGFLIVHNLIDGEAIGRLAERTDLLAAEMVTRPHDQYVTLEQALPDAGAGNRGGTTAVRKMYQLARHDEVLRGHAFGGTMVDVIADLLGTDDLKLYNDRLFMKPAYHGGEQPWHQDSQAWMNMFPMDMVTAWTAIDEATVANGCL